MKWNWHEDLVISVSKIKCPRISSTSYRHLLAKFSVELLVLLLFYAFSDCVVSDFLINSFEQFWEFLWIFENLSGGFLFLFFEYISIKFIVVFYNLIIVMFYKY